MHAKSLSKDELEVFLKEMSGVLRLLRRKLKDLHQEFARLYEDLPCTPLPDLAYVIDLLPLAINFESRRFYTDPLAIWEKVERCLKQSVLHLQTL